LADAETIMAHWYVENTFSTVYQYRDAGDLDFSKTERKKQKNRSFTILCQR